MGNGTRTDRSFDEAYQMELDELRGRGKKNAKHAEEVHDEIERTRSVIASYLARRLPDIDPDNWEDSRVAAAIKDFCDRNPFAIAPDHATIAHYDLRTLAAILTYNLDGLVFERDECVSARDVRELMHIRNDYEHRTAALNYRDWQKDIETLRVLRSKMQTDQELSDEQLAADELSEMERSSVLYQEELDAVQRQVDAITSSVVDLGQSVRTHEKNDADQFDELERQRRRDQSHDEAIDENRGDIEWLTKRDRTQKYAIVALAALGVANVVMWIAALRSPKGR